MTYIITETRKKSDLVRAVHTHYDGTSKTGESKSLISINDIIVLREFNPFRRNPTTLGIQREYRALLDIANWYIGEGHNETLLTINNNWLNHKLGTNNIQHKNPMQLQEGLVKFLKDYDANFKYKS